MMDLADIFNAPSDEEDFFGFEPDIPIETLSLDKRNENVDLSGTSGMAMELEPDNNPTLKEEDKEKEEEMEIQSSYKKKSFKIRGALQLPNKESAKNTSSKFCSSNNNQTKNTNGRNEDQDTSSDSEIDEASDENSNVLLKREQNIKENKAVLAQLLAELDFIPPSIQTKTSSSAPKRKKKPRNISSRDPIQRRTNPTRSARPPENFGVEKRLPVKYLDNKTYRRSLKRKLNGRILQMPKKGKLSIAALQSIVITNEDLANIAYTNKDKIRDKILGTTCHQCRQKTTDTKTICRNEDCVTMRGQFCGPCLRNRYGEDVKVALLNPEWMCPPCRRVCNCSHCRKRDGYCATGALIHLAKGYGYSNVREYLESLPMHHHVNGNH
ncbi:cell division cycle-associated 7-like protein [Protobothrops mucrosquamatus]|uniref:cell division cycle-associated 7-like protein n=1 Tax=Protobothrops mucrosquamatus TaxID=103944 RepID=UPI000775D765|nr:cell division cycle-associated 7-like protein [Protobothrops mucrosquamatus]